MVHADHPLARAGQATLADLENYPLASAVELPPSSAIGNAGSIVCDNFHVLRETVLQTDCVWMSSPAFLRDDLRAGRITQLDVSDLPAASSDICLVFKRGRTRSPAAVAAAEEVRAMLDAMIGS
jgi:DNA-binding transcriptional LysR family regulator